MGISRSTTIVIAYLVATTRMTPREALAAVQSKRAIVRPNRGFMSQLEEYHSTLSNSLEEVNLTNVGADAEDEVAPKPGNEKPEPEARRRSPRGRAAADGGGGGGGGKAWSVKNAAKSYVRSALTATTCSPSSIPKQQRGGRECGKVESLIS
jgi:Dual specificity phosphatase, catalytic domain